MATFSHTPRKSSHIKSFVYDDATGAVTVTFAHDRLKEPVSVAHKVPREVFDAWVKWSSAGHSAGSYFHRFVRKHPLHKLQ